MLVVHNIKLYIKCISNVWSYSNIKVVGTIKTKIKNHVLSFV